MAFFGTPNAFLGLDIGTSSLKIVELVNRHRRLEVATYAQANTPNLLLHPANEDTAIRKVGSIISRMMDKARASTDNVVVALPSSIVFSTVITLPALSDEEMDRAVHFEAKEIIPAALEDMVLGWSRIVSSPHMDTDAEIPETAAAEAAQALAGSDSAAKTVPVFVTAAPKDIVNRYIRLLDELDLQLLALEVETFPLARSLLQTRETALIADIGDQTTTFHIIDQGTSRVSHTIELGGHSVNQAIADSLHIPVSEAENQKVTHGLSTAAPPELATAITRGLTPIMTEARNISDRYHQSYQREVKKSVLIGGSASLKDLAPAWSRALGHPASVGNPWKGLAYPVQLENRLKTLGSTYAVAVGLALRGFK